MKEDYVFGHAYEEKIEKEDIDYFANLFGEGSKALTDLIKYCMENDIKTFASCKGHPEEQPDFLKQYEKGYISFRVSDDDLNTAYFLASLPHIIDGILADVDNYYDKKSINIYVPATKEGMSEKYFEDIFKVIKSYKEKDYINFQVEENIKNVVDMYMHYPSNDIFEITSSKYRKFIGNRKGRKNVVECPRKENTSFLHEKFCELFKKPKNVDDLLLNDSYNSHR